MQLTTDISKDIGFHTYHIRASTLLPLEGGLSRMEHLMAMVAHSDARIKVLTEELNKVEKLLDDASEALADAGIPYQQGNVRERINAYKVFKDVMIFPV